MHSGDRRRPRPSAALRARLGQPLHEAVEAPFRGLGEERHRLRHGVVGPVDREGPFAAACAEADLRDGGLRAFA
ncbi:MAG: hypothetical protein ACK559_34395, partial [bacterium]